MPGGGKPDVKNSGDLVNIGMKGGPRCIERVQWEHVGEVLLGAYFLTRRLTRGSRAPRTMSWCLPASFKLEHARATEQWLPRARQPTSHAQSSRPMARRLATGSSATARVSS